MGYIDLMQYQIVHKKMLSNEGQTDSSGFSYMKENIDAAPNRFSAFIKKIKESKKKKLIWVFVGFLLLKLIIVSIIFIAPRVVEHLRT